MTLQDFSLYSARMDAEFAGLEEKIQQTAQLCNRLREENRQLRQEVSSLQLERRTLADKIDAARERVENLLKQIPE